ncbi:MAG: IS110 family transposase [Flavobacteriales bacterium]|nr:IS110 family transposase [Flavobacteriales bacterium]
MNKSNVLIGIDISKDSFDVFSEETGHLKFSNDPKGYRAFYKQIKSMGACCVMEATGSYHYCLANWLYKKGIGVSVVNALVIKRYMQMKLRVNKTDKSDAQMIASFAREQDFPIWSPDPEYISRSKALFSLLELYTRQSTMLKNKLHSLETMGLKGGRVLASLRRRIKATQKEIKDLEAALEELIKENDAALYEGLKTIPGVGKKTAMMLIASTNGFRNFDSSKQVSSYFGLAPNHRVSGSSIRGRSYISKRGNPMVRNHLFLCSFTACKCNPQCAALFDRIVAKGKSKKLALIAVANKLIKQAYAISQSGGSYDPTYRSKLA